MKRRRILALLLAVVFAVFVGVLFRAYRQESLDNALISALKRDDVEKTRTLLAQGADPNASDWSGQPRSFWQRLWPASASASDTKEPLQSALQVSLNANPPAVAGSDNTPLFGKAPPGKRAIIEALLYKGADAKVIDASGFSTFGIAIRQNYADVALLCLEKGARVNYFEMAMAFERAINSRDADTVKTLLEKGAEPNIEIPHADTIRLDDWQWSYSQLPALIYAVLNHEKAPEDPDGKRKASVVNVLLDGGADIGIQDSEGRTALIWAAFLSDENMVALLLQRGADRTQAAKDGDTALNVARRRNNPTILRLLRQPD